MSVVLRRKPVAFVGVALLLAVVALWKLSSLSSEDRSSFFSRYDLRQGSLPQDQPAHTVVHYDTVYVDVPPGNPEPIVFVFVTVGAKNAEEGTIAIKSALMRTSRPLQFHIMCTPDARPVHEARFALFSRPQYPVEVFYYEITGDSLRERSLRAGVGHNYNVLVKLFIHELVDVEKAIFMDTDMMLVGMLSCFLPVNIPKLCRSRPDPIMGCLLKARTHHAHILPDHGPGIRRGAHLHMRYAPETQSDAQCAFHDVFSIIRNGEEVTRSDCVRAGDDRRRPGPE